MTRYEDMKNNSNNNDYDADTEDNVLPATTGASIATEVNNFIDKVQQTAHALNHNYLQASNLSTSTDEFIAELK